METERSGLLSDKNTTPIDSEPNSKLDVKHAGEEDNDDGDPSRKEKVQAQ